jgi:solute carrier family 13 (sodium-dependent dicarboxylate transporter), member 2/3/5
MSIETREPGQEREARRDGDGLQRSTYRTLDEQEGRLSEAEQRFERRRRTVGLFLGPIVFAAMLLILFALDGHQHRLAAILAFVIVWWLTEAIPIPVTALLGVVLCALLEATPPPPEGRQLRRRGLRPLHRRHDLPVHRQLHHRPVPLRPRRHRMCPVVHGLHRRLAFRVLSMRSVGGSTFRIILAFGLIGALTSPVMSNTAGAAMMLPIALGVMGVVGGMVASQAGGELNPERLRFGAAIMVPIAISIAAASDLNPTIPALAAIFGANYGFMLPVSTPPNAIVYSSGLLPITRMLKAGAVFDIIGAVLCVVGVIAMANVVGLA